MTSKRLPQKPLRDLAGREILGRVLDRVSGAKSVSRVIVATSTHRTDDPLATFCEKEATYCFRGSLYDVAGRMLAAADELKAPVFIRISGDSPVIDPQLIDRGVGVYRELRPDLATNVFPRTFPAGQSVEVIDTEALRTLRSKNRGSGDAADGREHVTSGFYRAPQSWKIVNFTSGLPGPHPSMAVDTAEDLSRIQGLLHRVDDGPAGWRDLLDLLAVQ
jgi:spore coat polysaccharide biosynthesis protein SpsF (cytidylyltransferase family)